MQRRGKFDQAHAAAHPPEVAEKPRDLRIVAAYDAIQVDDQNAVLHVLNDQPIDLLQVRDVDAALRRKVFGEFRVAPERDGNADGCEIAKADKASLEYRRGTGAAVDGAIGFQSEQHHGGERRVEKSRSRTLQPTTRGKLGEQQDRQRGPAIAGGDHGEREEKHVAGEHRE